MQVVLATHNAHKVVELRQILGDGLGGIELVAYRGPEPVEDGETFAANALIKARAAFESTGLTSIADDSGISVDALDGAPGIHSARYSGTRDDAVNLALLLTNLGDATNRAAYFTCAAALVDADGEHVETRTWVGGILAEAVGVGGFGYDPIFKPNGFSVSAGELRAEEKNQFSHRAQAFRALLPVLRARMNLAL